MALTKVLFLLAAVVLATAEDDDGFGPTIDIFPNNDNTLNVGENFRMRCRSEAERDAKTIWFKETEKEPMDFSKFPFIETNSRGDLIFINPQPGENDPTGKYTCHMTNRFGKTKLGYFVKVGLAYFEDEFRYIPRPSFFYDIQGSNMAWANCLPPHSHPQITATYLNGSSGLPANLDDPRVTIRHLIRNGVYTQIIIQNATKADAGKWACVAKHRTLGEKKVFFDISFYGPPEPPKNMRVKQSRAAGLIMEWDYVRNDLAYYDIAITNTADKTRRNLRFNESLSPRLEQYLTYEFTDLTQSTEYSIEMRATDQKGQVGEWSAPFVTTTIDEMPPLGIQNPPEETRVGEGRTVDIVCVIEGLPPPTFEWFKDGDKLTENQDLAINGGVLTIKNAKRGVAGSEGNYKCKATNKHGTKESTEGKLVVEWLDKRFQIEPRDRFFYAADKFLRVSARLPKGVEPITVQWRQARKLIRPKTHPLFSDTLYRGPTGKLFYSLDIRTPTIVQSDIYHVTAYNLGGVVHKEFKLLLAPPPQPIGIFNITDQRHGALSVKWERPRSGEHLRKKGFPERIDIQKYELMHKKASDTGNGTIISIFRDTYKYTITGLDVDVGYIARIRAIDNGNQIGAWSLDLKFKLDKDLPPSITNGPPETSEAKIGESLTLPCEVSADKTVRIKWFQDDVEIQRSQSGYTYLQNNGLSLENIKRTMAGSYHCQATTRFGKTDSEKGEVKIVFLEREYQYIKKVVGIHNREGFRDARILCIPPKSFPRVTVLWANNTADKFLKRNNPRIVMDNNYFKDNVRYYSLLIRDAIDLVGQKYGCVVYNPVIGTEVFYNENTEIKMFGKPEKPEVQYRLSSTGALILEWTSEREDITKYEITVKNGNKVDQSLTTQEKTHEFRGLSNTVLYSFEVVAVDVASQKSDPGSVTMAESAPTVRKDLPSEMPLVVQGKDYVFNCDFYGYPLPTVTWFKDGRELSSDKNYRMEDGNRKLTLVKADHAVHNGEYHCEGKNKAGSRKSEVANVAVTYIEPNFKYASDSYAFVNRDGKRGVQFACAPPNAYPPFNFNGDHVHWLMDGKPLINPRMKKSRKTIEGVEADVIEFIAVPSDIGTYSCAYPHPAGTKKHDMRLTIKDGARKPVNVAIKAVSYNFFTMSWGHAGDEIIGYNLRVSHHGSLVREERVSKATTEYIFDNMSPKTVYDFSISSLGIDTNSFPVSLLVNTTARPIIGVPSIVRNVEKVNVGSTSATLTWEVPATLKNNHPDRLTYEIKICVGENTNCKIVPERVNKRTYTFTQLAPVTIYKFFITVYAETSSPGPVYTGTMQTLNGGAPPAILNFVPNPSWNSITVSWKPPHITDLQRIQHYILTISSPSLKKRRVEVSKDRTSYFYLNLEEGQEYTIGIMAHNNGVDGPVNQRKIKTLDLGTPGKPRNVIIKKNEDPLDASVIAISFEWGPPTELAHNPIDEIKYQVKICDFQEKCESSEAIPSRSYTFNNKKAGITYSYAITTLRADEGLGDAAIGEFNSYKDLISEVENLRKGFVEGGDRSLSISWGMPQKLLGNTVNSIKFKVQYCRKSNNLKYGCVDTVADGTSIELTNLIPSTDYLITIRALSPAGLLGVPSVLEVATDNPQGRTTLPPLTQRPARTAVKTTTEETIDFEDNVGGKAGGRENIVKEGLSTGSIIGIVLAVIIIAILVSVAVIVYMRRNKQSGVQSKKMPNNGYIVEVEMDRRKQQQGTFPRDTYPRDTYPRDTYPRY